MIEVVHTDNIDHFGSWVEVGMIAGVVIAGALTALLPILSRLKKRSKGTSRKQLGYPNSVNWEEHTRIHEVLTELRVKTDSARTQVIQFHNGGHFLDGISMTKMSLTHESLANGVSSEMDTKKELMLSLCVEGLRLLLEDDSKIHITAQLDDSWCKQLLQHGNVVAFGFLPLRKQKEVQGYIMIQWCSWNKTDNVDEDVVTQELEDSRVLTEVQLRLQSGDKSYK